MRLPRSHLTWVGNVTDLYLTLDSRYYRDFEYLPVFGGNGVRPKGVVDDGDDNNDEAMNIEAMMPPVVPAKKRRNT